VKTDREEEVTEAPRLLGTTEVAPPGDLSYGGVTARGQWDLHHGRPYGSSGPIACNPRMSRISMCRPE
jgi:hypothetical protein